MKPIRYHAPCDGCCVGLIEENEKLEVELAKFRTAHGLLNEQGSEQWHELQDCKAEVKRLTCALVEHGCTESDSILVHPFNSGGQEHKETELWYNTALESNAHLAEAEAEVERLKRREAVMEAELELLRPKEHGGGRESGTLSGGERDAAEYVPETPSVRQKAAANPAAFPEDMPTSLTGTRYEQPMCPVHGWAYTRKRGRSWYCFLTKSGRVTDRESEGHWRVREVPAAPFFCPTCGSDPHEPDCPAARKEPSK